MGAVLGLGLLLGNPAPAEAKPPVHAKAHGYRRKAPVLVHRTYRPYHSRYSVYHDRDRDGIPNWRDRDKDGDGIRNGRDRHDRRPQPYVRRPVRRDWDRDGIRNRRDWDVDGDGVRNRRDRDKDGDGLRNRRDRHDKNARRR
jgi:hypothetical protein